VSSLLLQADAKADIIVKQASIVTAAARMSRFIRIVRVNVDRMLQEFAAHLVVASICVFNVYIR
jgi:hypothetical protein